MALTYSDFSTRFPELVASPAPTGAEQTWIEAREVTALARLSASVFLTLHSEAALLMVAHQWAIYRQSSDSKQPAGRLTSKSVGDWSVSFAGPAPLTGDRAYWGLTIYGEQYIDIRNSRLSMVDRLSM